MTITTVRVAPLSSQQIRESLADSRDEGVAKIAAWADARKARIQARRAYEDALKAETEALRAVFPFVTTVIELTQREQEVLALVLRGKVNKEIAVALKIEVRTVKFHLSSLYQKYNVPTRNMLITKLRMFGADEEVSKESEVT